MVTPDGTDADERLDWTRNNEKNVSNGHEQEMMD
jgi:hypothetical protein